MSSIQVESFGTVDGTDIQQVTIRSRAGAEAKILTWGAVVRDLLVPSASGPQRVVLGLNTIDDYRAHSPYFGAIAGRFANRIAEGRFTLDGTTYDLPRNEARACLHGGPHGFGTRPWRIRDFSEQSVTLAFESPDGDQGFPGSLEALCTYTLLEPATLRVDLSATTDKPTVVNLTNHSYFNLDGSPDILGHELTIRAGARTPTDADLIPTGEILAVDGTPYDFRQARPIRNPAGQVYDDNFVLARDAGPGALAHAATVRSKRSGVTLDLYTDQPGLQFYDAAKLACPVSGLDGARYGVHAGLCLETQVFPDAPNHPNFPSSVLRPGERYAHATEFRFS